MEKSLNNINKKYEDLRTVFASHKKEKQVALDRHNKERRELQIQLARVRKQKTELRQKFEKTWRRRFSRAFKTAIGAKRERPRSAGVADERTNWKNLYKLADDKIAESDWLSVIGVWQPVLEAVDPTPPARAFLDTSRSHRARGNLALAEQIAMQGIRIHSADLALATELARIATEKKDWVLAEEHWQSVLLIGGRRTPAGAFLELAKSRRRNGELIAAEAALLEGTSRHPAHVGLLSELASVAMDRNNWAEAEKRWEVVLHRANNAAPPRVFRELARCRRLRGALDDAAETLRRGTTAHPEDLALAAALDEILMIGTSWEDAVVRWRRTHQAELEKSLSLHLNSNTTPGTSTRKEPSNNRVIPLPQEERVVVYTCLFGNYETPKEPLFKDPRVRWVLFTDDSSLTSSAWEVRVVTEALSSPRRSSRMPKILPHIFLEEHDISLYIDSSLEIRAPDILFSVHLMLGDKDLALYRHHSRNSVYEEIECCEKQHLESHELCAWYRNFYESVPLPPHLGLFENTLIARRNTKEIRALNEQWWSFYGTLGGQRDQLCFPAALHAVGMTPNSIAQGEQVRNNPFVNFHRHHRTAAPAQNPRIFIFIAFAPEAYGRDLGRVYNEYMERLGEDDVAVFIDHDAMLCGSNWASLIDKVVKGCSRENVLFVGRCNRIGNPYQRLNLLEDSHNLWEHAVASDVVAEECGDALIDVTRMPSSSGVVMIVPKRTWNKNKFELGFLKVDNNFHKAVAKNNGKVYLLEGLYVYHFYRGDGDELHAVRLKTVPEADGGLHFVRNTIYEVGATIEVSAYANILRDGEWLFLSRSNRSSVQGIGTIEFMSRYVPCPTTAFWL